MVVTSSGTVTSGHELTVTTSRRDVDERAGTIEVVRCPPVRGARAKPSGVGLILAALDRYLSSLSLSRFIGGSIAASMFGYYSHGAG
jgi:hypothetical protein